MQSGKPSRTALAAASHRAAHQILEEGRIFRDPLALRIVGRESNELAKEGADPARRKMRIFIAARTRFAEDALSAAVENGVEQLVVLGAELDTFAFRSPYRERLRVFEVDHPATQEWKRERLQGAGILSPSWLTFAPIDFERQTLGTGLEAAGFEPRRSAFFTWLGVVPYLSEDTVWSTLGFIGNLPAQAQVVFDYSNPPDQLSSAARESHDQRAAHVEKAGEAWVTYFDSDALHTRLASHGFVEIQDLNPRRIAERYFSNRSESAPTKGGHILLASTRGVSGLSAVRIYHARSLVPLV
jgi:methyltransferase (TIGR00027 family)